MFILISNKIFPCSAVIAVNFTYFLTLPHSDLSILNSRIKGVSKGAAQKGKNKE